jgi:small subunit ribosomal protein S17
MAPAAKSVEKKQATTKAPAQTATETTIETPKSRKVVSGVVVSDKMQKTIVVEVNSRIKHPLYKKYYVRSKRYKAHDEQNKAKIGDLVEIRETKPISKQKRWALKQILRHTAVQI